MSAASNDLEDKLLDHVLRNTSYSQPSTLRIALFAGTASDVLAALEAGTGSRSGTGNWGHYEITGGAYERKAITFAGLVIPPIVSPIPNTKPLIKENILLHIL